MASVLKANLIDTCRGNDHLSAPSLLRKMDLVTNLEKKGTETQNGPTIRVLDHLVWLPHFLERELRPREEMYLGSTSPKGRTQGRAHVS